MQDVLLCIAEDQRVIGALAVLSDRQSVVNASSIGRIVQDVVDDAVYIIEPVLVG
jgi:hypothetical protein